MYCMKRTLLLKLHLRDFANRRFSITTVNGGKKMLTFRLHFSLEIKYYAALC